MPGNISSDQQASAKPKDRFVASNLVTNPVIYDRDGHKLGTIHSFIVDKRTGQVAYAILSFGGFLGLGQTYHPLPWGSLAYDLGRDGYLVNVDKAMLEGSPSYRPDDAPQFDEAYGQRVSTYYGVPTRL